MPRCKGAETAPLRLYCGLINLIAVSNSASTSELFTEACQLCMPRSIPIALLPNLSLQRFESCGLAIAQVLSHSCNWLVKDNLCSMWRLK